MATLVLDGVNIAQPGGPGASGGAGVEVGTFRLSKSSRAADGTMAFELIAIKHQVTLSWDKIIESDLATILNQLDTSSFHSLTYPDPQGTNGSSTITVYCGDIKQRAWYRDASGHRWWDSVSITLIEQ